MTTILVADDDDDFRIMLRSAIGNIYTLVEAASGYSALEKVMRQRFDLIIVDLNMPGLNGIELIENLPRRSSHHQETPVIVISGFLDTPKFKKALSDLQPAAVLRKPFQISELLAAISKALPER